MLKKIAIVAGVALICAIAALVFYLNTQLDPLVANAIEDYGRKTTGTDVDVGGVELALTSGSGKIGDIEIGNPPGFSTDYFLRVRDTHVAIDVGSLRGDVPVIREIALDGAHLNAEQRGNAINVMEIQKKITGGGGGDAPATESSEGRVIIDRFRLSHARVTVTSEALDHPEDLELADVVVEGIGRSTGGATYDAAATAVLTPIVAAVRSAFEGRVRAAATDAARDELREIARDKLNELIDRN
jgi:hypothetical protein